MAAFLRLLHLEAEAVALIAEIDRRLVHQMAVHAVELILIVRRDMWNFLAIVTALLKLWDAPFLSSGTGLKNCRS